MDEQHYVIWSEEHGGWWGKGRRGYTRSLAEAGRYSKEETQGIVSRANRYLPPKVFYEVAFPEPGEKFLDQPSPKSHESAHH